VSRRRHTISPERGKHKGATAKTGLIVGHGVVRPLANLLVKGIAIGSGARRHPRGRAEPRHQT
jgi:hypothetical protein